MVTDLVDFDEHPLPAWENFPCYDCVMMPPDTSPAADETTRADIALEQALVMARPLVTWLLRSGIGFGTFTTALKPVFLAQAGHELGEGRVTDSALSLLSGLHRKDVRALRASGQSSLDAIDARTLAQSKPSAANQVLTRWLTNGWPTQLELTGTVQSFDTLARSVSSDVHPRAVLDELMRLGLVVQEGMQVHLLHEAFTPVPHHTQAQELFAANVADHLAAGLHNLRPSSAVISKAAHQHDQTQQSFLEQSVFADGLSAASVATLHQLANTLWFEALERVVQAAIPLCANDHNTPHPQRFRLGMFSYSQPEHPRTANASPTTPPIDESGDPHAK